MQKALFTATLMFLTAGLLLTLGPEISAAKKKPPPEPPSAVLDQVQTDSGPDATIYIMDHGAQTFVPGGDGELTQVELEIIFQQGTFDDEFVNFGLTVEIQETAWEQVHVVGAPSQEYTWVPSGVVLASSFLPMDQFTDGVQQWYTFSFSSPSDLLGGTPYAVVVKSDGVIPPEGQTPHKYHWKLFDGGGPIPTNIDAYADGEMFLASIGWDFNWSIGMYPADYTFKTWMIFDTPADPVEICDDGIDNDGDNKIDCADKKDCRTDPYCF